MKVFVALVVVGLIWGQMSGASDEITAEQEHYCNMVAEGTWPDYKDTYDASCQ